jgi:hypothetical protein
MGERIAMQDAMVRLFSPLLVVAAMLATQPAMFGARNHDAARDWAVKNATGSCHGTRLGNNLGSACAAPFIPAGE